MKSAILDQSQRAKLFIEAATLADAGLPIGDALASVAKGLAKPNDVALRRVSSAVKKGTPASKAMLRAGFIDDVAAQVLAAGELSGEVGRVLRRLATRAEAAAKLAQRVRARMVMPAAVVTIAVFVAPLPALVSGELDEFGYLVRTVGTLLVLFPGIWTLIKLIGWARKTSTFGPMADRVELAIPLVGGIQRRRATTDFIESLAISYGSGVALLDALPASTATVANSLIGKECSRAAAALEAGQTLDAALDQLEHLDVGSRALIMGAEASGRIEETLDRIVLSERARLDDDDKQLGEWLPRIVYFTVGAWMISQILGSGLGAP